MRKVLKFLIIFWVISGSFIFIMWRYRVNKINNDMSDITESVKKSEILKIKYGNIKKVKWIKKSGMKYKDISCVTYLIKTDKTEEKICVLGHRGISDKKYRLDAIKIDDKLYEFFEPYNYNDYKDYVDNYTGEKIVIEYEDYIDIYWELYNKYELGRSSNRFSKIDIKYDKENLSYYFKIEKWSIDSETEEELLIETYNIIINKEGVVEAIWN